MAAIAFPNIEPTTRRYNPGEFPRTMFESQNGSMTAVYFGDRPVNGTLEMTFRNIHDDLAHDIINHYKRCNRADDQGNWNYATMPNTASGALAGIGDSALRQTIGETADNRRYRYAEAPVLTSVFPGYSSVTVKLVAMIESANARID